MMKQAALLPCIMSRSVLAVACLLGVTGSLLSELLGIMVHAPS
jgi:hypothetical protein